MTPAGKIQAHLSQCVKTNGGFYRKVRWEGRVGCPDCFVSFEWPNAAFVEVKAGRDRFSEVQKRECARMKAHGIPVYVVRSIEDVDALMETLLKQGLQP